MSWFPSTGCSTGVLCIRVHAAWTQLLLPFNNHVGVEIVSFNFMVRPKILHSQLFFEEHSIDHETRGTPQAISNDRWPNDTKISEICLRELASTDAAPSA